MRKLATIRRIDAINPIPDADAIEVATVGGWKVVVKRGEYAVGDLAVYCEIDSWIPHALAPFLSKGEPKEYNGVKGERLRTVRLRGQVSQGLLLPFNTCMSNYEGECSSTDWNLDDDVTDLLGIQKYEPPIPAQLAGEVRGPFPSSVPKTDQERVQNLSAEIAEWQGLEFEITEKLDGTSCTFFLDQDQDLHVCSRNLDLKENPDNSLWRVAIRYGVRERMIELGLANCAVQGELIGEGIQGNKYGLKGQDFFVFDIYRVNEARYMSHHERLMHTNSLGLKHTPVIDPCVCVYADVSQLLSLAEGKSVLNDRAEREGLVFKCISNTDIHFKCISNRWLLKNE